MQLYYRAAFTNNNDIRAFVTSSAYTLFVVQLTLISEWCVIFCYCRRRRCPRHRGVEINANLIIYVCRSHYRVFFEKIVLTIPPFITLMLR